MKRKERDPLEDEFVWKPTHADTQKLAEGMSKFQRKQINGRWVYPFEQYVASKGIIGFDDHGSIIVKNVQEWIRLNEIDSLLKWEQERDLEHLFQTFPEEKVAHEQRIEAIKAECRAILSKTAV